MYVVYDCVQDGGVFVIAGLEDAGIPYRKVYVDLRKGENLEAAFTKINPRQQLVTIRLPDGSVMTEGVAIMLWIAEQHPKAELMPPPGSPERAQALRWLLFMATNLYEGENRKVHPERYAADPACAGAVREAANAYVDWHYRLIEAEIGQGPYFFGEKLCLVDLYLWMLIQWHRDLEWLETQCPKLLRLVETVMVRPKIEPIHLANFGPGIGLCAIEQL